MINNIKKYIYTLLNYLRDSQNNAISYSASDEKDIIIDRSVDNAEKIIPKIVWLYWEDENVPPLINMMVNQVRNVFTTYVVNLVTNKNLSEYLQDLTFLQNLPLANKSDIIRLDLLYKYGGIWIDSSVVIAEFPTWLKESMSMKKYDLIAFYRDKATVDKNNPVIESWFLACPAKNDFIKSWLHILSPLKDLGVDQYFQHIVSRSDYFLIRQNIDTPKYLLVYLAMQIAIRQFSHVNFFLRKSEASAFLYQEHSRWAPYKGISNLTIKKFGDSYPSIIKLTKLCRLEVEYMLKFNFIAKNSLFNFIYKIR